MSRWTVFTEGGWDIWQATSDFVDDVEPGEGDLYPHQIVAIEEFFGVTIPASALV